MKRLIIVLLLIMATVSAYSCDADTLFWATLNETGGSSYRNACNGTLMTNYSVYTTTGVFSEAGDFESVDSSYVDTNIDQEVTANSTLLAWINVESFNGAYWVVQSDSGGGGASLSIYLADYSTNSTMRCGFSDGAAPSTWAYSSVTVTPGDWYFAECVYMDNGTGGCITLNGTTDCNAAAEAPDSSGNYNWSIGRLGEYDGFYADGKMDEVSVWDRALLGHFGVANSEIGNISAYNDISGGGGAPAGNNATVVLNNPADADHDNNFTAQFTGTWYDADDNFTNCSLFANSTYSGINNAIINSTIESVTNDTLQGDGYYSWFVGCQFASNGTYLNATARGFYLDTTAPNVTITTPSSGQSFYYADSNNLDVSANDTYLYNLTCDIFHGNGTYITQYINDTGTPPVFTLTNEFTSGLAEGEYYANCSAVDSHTGNDWHPQHWEKTTDGLLVYDGGEYNITFLGMEGAGKPADLVVTATKLKDRIKFGWEFTGLANRWYRIRVNANSVKQIIGSEYFAHFVLNNHNWIDFQDLANAGMDGLEIAEIGADYFEIRFDPPGTGNKYIIIDPATGGLNLGFSVNNFTIAPDAQISANATSFYKDAEGYILVYYENITDGSLIPGADCVYNITDPYGNKFGEYNASEKPLYYQANYTPSFTGVHTFEVTCNKTGWSTLSISGTFSVSSTPPSERISVVVGENKVGYSNTICADPNTMRYYYNKTACIGSTCEDVVVYEDVLCELGCIGNTCQRSLVKESGVIGLWVVMFAMAGAFIWLGRRFI